MSDINTIRTILQDNRVIAMVGLSDKPYRPSFFAASYLLEYGYEIIPVNPMCDSILGQKSYPDLQSVDKPVDIVDCFRRPQEMPELARQAVAMQARVLWMQLGIQNAEARDIAHNGGLQVVENRCTKIEHGRLYGGLGYAGVNTRVISASRLKSRPHR